MQMIATSFIKFFPIWVIISAAVAYLYPGTIIALNLNQYVSILLGVVMLGMGLTMSPTDFKMVLTKPGLVLLGVAMRCILMPVIAYIIAQLLRLPSELAAGLILVGCCPSGTASNVMALLAKGDTALSVTLTSVITLLSPIVTPISFYILAGSYIHVELWPMFLSILCVVIIPVAVGILFHLINARFVEYIRIVVPIISVVAIIIIIMVVVAGNAQMLSSMAGVALIAVILHNGLGLATGYGFSRLFGLTKPQSRTIAFEIGMENSGLAVVLVGVAGLNPIAAIPAAIFSVWHNLSGSVLAGIWSSQVENEARDSNHK